MKFEKSESERKMKRQVKDGLKMLASFGAGLTLGFATIHLCGGCAPTTRTMTISPQQAAADEQEAIRHSARCDEMYEDADIAEMRDWCFGEHGIHVRVAARRAACQTVEEYERACASY